MSNTSCAQMEVPPMELPWHGKVWAAGWTHSHKRQQNAPERLWVCLLLKWKLLLVLHSMAVQVQTTWHVKTSWQKKWCLMQARHIAASMCGVPKQSGGNLDLNSAFTAFQWLMVIYGDFHMVILICLIWSYSFLGFHFEKHENYYSFKKECVLL